MVLQSVPRVEINRKLPYQVLDFEELEWEQDATYCLFRRLRLS